MLVATCMAVSSWPRLQARGAEMLAVCTGLFALCQWPWCIVTYRWWRHFFARGRPHPLGLPPQTRWPRRLGLSVPPQTPFQDTRLPLCLDSL